MNPADNNSVGDVTPPSGKGPLNQPTSLKRVRYVAGSHGNLDVDGCQFLPSAIARPAIDRLSEAVTDAMDVLEARAVVRDRSGHVRMAYGLHLVSPLIDTIARRGSWVSAIATSLGSAVYLYQSKLTINPPQSTAGWGWHQDFWPWHERDSVPAPNLFSAIVFLDDVDEHSGGIAVVPGSHKLALDDFEKRRQLVENLEAAGDVEDSHASCPVGPAGSVLLFHALSTHGSAANHSERQRRLLILTYNSCLNPPRTFSSTEWLCARDLTPCAAASG